MPHGAEAAEMIDGLPTSDDGLVCFDTLGDPSCTRVATEKFLAGGRVARFSAEMERLGLARPTRIALAVAGA
jgi:hypothetical protein